MIDLAQGACEILLAAEPADKVARALALAGRLARRQRRRSALRRNPPTRPARPERPLLLPPRDMPKRKAGGNQEKRVALLHALAHIELNAIDLAWDIIARFGTAETPRAFFDDWVKVGEEEAIHFSLLAGASETSWARSMATCPPMTACGRRRRKHRTICSPASPSCRWCWRRAAST